MEHRHKRRVPHLALVVIIGATVLWWGANWLIIDRFTTQSDDAYVVGDIVAVAARVGGHVTEVAVEDNQPVAAGDLLFRIDDRSYRAALARAEAEVLRAKSAISTLEAQDRLQGAVIRQAEAGLAQARAALDLAKRSHDRAQKLASSNVASVASLDTVQTALQQAEAQGDLAEATLAAAQMQRELIAEQKRAAVAGLAAATATRDAAQVDLESTNVTAPVQGVVGNRTVQRGRFVAVGMPVLDLVPLGSLWIEANLKETQMEGLAIGQMVDVAVDSFPSAPIRGVVDSISPGSGAAFSLFAPDNATGNFVRIVQRVPVKIRLTDVPDSLRLVPGLSARVIIHDQPVPGDTASADPMRLSATVTQE